MKTEDFKKLKVYKDIIFSHPREVILMLDKLKRIPGFDYRGENYTNGEIMSFPVYLEENKNELEKLFNIDKYLERVHNIYSVDKEYEGQSVVDLVALIYDFGEIHPICIRMDIDTDDYILYDPDADENFDYYYKLEDEFSKKIMQVCNPEECSGEFVAADVKGETKYFCCQKGFEKSLSEFTES